MALCTRPPTNTHLTAASAGRRLHFIPKSRGAAPQLADSLEDKHRRRWGTSGSSFPPNQRQGTLDLCPAPPPAKHTPLRGTWRPGRAAQGAWNTCVHAWWLAVSASPRNLASGVPELVSTAQHGPGSPKAPCGGTRGGKSAMVLHPLARPNKNTRNETEEPPSGV